METRLAGMLVQHDKEIQEWHRRQNEERAENHARHDEEIQEWRRRHDEERAENLAMQARHENEIQNLSTTVGQAEANNRELVDKLAKMMIDLKETVRACLLPRVSASPIPARILTTY